MTLELFNAERLETEIVVTSWHAEHREPILMNLAEERTFPVLRVRCVALLLKERSTLAM